MTAQLKFNALSSVYRSNTLLINMYMYMYMYMYVNQPYSDRGPSLSHPLTLSPSHQSGAVCSLSHPLTLSPSHQSGAVCSLSHSLTLSPEWCCLFTLSPSHQSGAVCSLSHPLTLSPSHPLTRVVLFVRILVLLALLILFPHLLHHRNDLLRPRVVLVASCRYTDTHVYVDCTVQYYGIIIIYMYMYMYMYM